MTPEQIELHPCSDSTRFEADQRIPYASLAFLDLQSKYNSSLPTDALQLVMAYDLAKQSFSGNNLKAWTGSVLKQWNKLCNVKKYHDDEYLAVLQLLLTLQTKNGVWNEWAANYCTHFSDPKNFKVSAFVANVLEKLRLDTLAIQHRENGRAQAAAHYDSRSGGNGRINEGLVSSNMAKAGTTDDTDDHDKLFLTMANVGNTCFLSSSIHLAGLLLRYSKNRLLDSTHDLHLHVDAGHMTRIRDRYARLDSTYTPLQEPLNPTTLQEPLK